MKRTNRNRKNIFLLNIETTSSDGRDQLVRNWTRCVCIAILSEHVAVGIVCISVSWVRGIVFSVVQIFAHKLIHGIILVGESFICIFECWIAAPDLGYVAVGVIIIVVLCVRTVAIGLNERLFGTAGWTSGEALFGVDEAVCNFWSGNTRLFVVIIAWIVCRTVVVSRQSSFRSFQCILGWGA